MFVFFLMKKTKKNKAYQNRTRNKTKNIIQKVNSKTLRLNIFHFW